MRQQFVTTALDYSPVMNFSRTDFALAGGGSKLARSLPPPDLHPVIN